MPEGMMKSSFFPVPHPVFKVRNDLGEIMLVAYFRIVVRIKAEKQKLSCSGISALIGFQ
jgi:hypothetical protein